MKEKKLAFDCRKENMYMNGKKLKKIKCPIIKMP